MEYTKPVVTKNELEVNADGTARGCEPTFTCKPSLFGCGSYDCSADGHKFTCTGW